MKALTPFVRRAAAACLFAGMGAPLLACHSGPCPSGAYQDPGGEYCLMLPPDYKPQPEQKSGDERYTKFVKGDPGNLSGSNYGSEFTVRVFPLDNYASEESLVTNAYGTVVERADLKDGKFVHVKLPATKQEAVKAVVKGPKDGIACSSQTAEDKPHPEHVPACKSLVALPAK